MTDEALELVKKVAVKLTIERKDDMVYFTVAGEITRNNKEYHKPRVFIAEQTLEDIIKAEQPAQEESLKILCELDQD